MSGEPQTPEDDRQEANAQPPPAEAAGFAPDAAAEGLEPPAPGPPTPEPITEKDFIEADADEAMLSLFGDPGEDFEAALTEHEESLRSYFEPGEKVAARVSVITDSTIFVDVGAKSEGIIERAELERDGELTVGEGDRVEAYFLRSVKGEMVFTTQVAVQDADFEALQQAFESGMPVQGKVSGERKGGFSVQFGAKDAFCPYSQIDRRPPDDGSIFVGQTLTFKVIECSDENLVVSRRTYLDEQAAKVREQLQQELEVDQIREGTVTKLMKFGAFVAIAEGLEGLIPMGELAWGRVQDAGEVVQPGDRVSVRILNIDWTRDRFTLSLRKAQGDPWEDVPENFPVGRTVEGTVARLMDFGAFITLAPGVDGLLPISRIGGGQRLAHANEVLAEGDTIDVIIDRVDLERQRLSLDLPSRRSALAAAEQEREDAARAAADARARLEIGMEILGRVEDVRPFGVFVKLGPGTNGLLHVSEVRLPERVDSGRELYKRYPPGSDLAVRVKRIEDGRIGLELPEAPTDEDDDYRAAQVKERKQADEGFGSLGGMFDGVEL